MSNNRKWIDKKKATSFQLVHRSHEDSRFYDEEASSNVLKPMVNGNLKKSQDNKGNKVRLETKDELESALNDEKMRPNEGEAALYGVTFDDSKYDYMQHLKPIGTGSGGIFISKEGNSSGEAKGKTKDSDIFKALEEVLPSGENRRLDYQDQQDIPDELKGFKPDMDPRLREVLEALEDEAFLDPDQDREDGDIFEDLLQGGEAIGSEGDYDDEDYDEYDLDQYQDEFDQDYGSDKEKAGSGTWEDDFNRFQKTQKLKKTNNEWDSDDDFDSEFENENEDMIGELPKFGESTTNTAKTTTAKKASKQKARRKKGAMTDTSSYSMSSSALFRTEGLRLLDDRYEQLLKKQHKEDYGLDGPDDDDDEEEEEPEFDMAKERPDLEALMDDFLENYETENGGRRIVKKNAEKIRQQQAALNASKGKMSALNEKEKGMDEVQKTLKNLKLA